MSTWSPNYCDARPEYMADAPRSNGTSQSYREFAYRGPSRAPRDTGRDESHRGDDQIAQVGHIHAEGFLRLETADGLHVGTAGADDLPRRDRHRRVERGHQGRSAVKWWLDVTNVFLGGLVAAPVIFLAIIWVIGR